jgi:hypothetical protein
LGAPFRRFAIIALVLGLKLANRIVLLPKQELPNMADVPAVARV